MPTLPTAKELKALAAACRAAGISKYKQGDLELEFSPQPPAKRTRRNSKAAPTPVQSEEIETEGWDSLSEEEKLMWSSAPSGIPLEASSQ